MRNLNNYYGEIGLHMGMYKVIPCVCNDVNKRHYAVYDNNIEYWRDYIEHEGQLRIVKANECINPYVHVCIIFGYTDKFFELDEINYLVHKIVRWNKFAKNGICLIDEEYFKTEKDVAWKIDFTCQEITSEYQLMDVCYEKV